MLKTHVQHQHIKMETKLLKTVIIIILIQVFANKRSLDFHNWSTDLWNLTDQQRGKWNTIFVKYAFQSKYLNSPSQNPLPYCYSWWSASATLLCWTNWSLVQSFTFQSSSKPDYHCTGFDKLSFMGDKTLTSLFLMPVFQPFSWLLRARREGIIILNCQKYN